MVCQKRKAHIYGSLINVLHILGPKKSLDGKPGYYGLQLEWLQCILVWLLQDYANRSYHVSLPQVVCQKRKPLIDGLYLNVLDI